MAALLLPLTAVPAAAQTLVSNTGQDRLDTNLPVGSPGGARQRHAQAFTTGGANYTLASVEIYVALQIGTPTFALEIWSTTSTNTPNARVSTLTNPGALTENAANTFTAPANATLAANTTYAIVAAAGGTGYIGLGYTLSDAEDGGSASGWTIRNQRHVSRDGGAWTASLSSMSISINGVANNLPTVAAMIPDQSATAGMAFSYTFPANTFSDVDSGDTLTYTATQDDDTTLPAWLGFDAATRTFSGTPPSSNMASTLSVKVTASDGVATVSDTFNITVAADTVAPTLISDVVNGSTLTLTYNEPLDTGSVPDASAFSVRVAGTTAAPSDVDVSGSTVTLTLATAALFGQSASLTYSSSTTNPIRDPAGNRAISLAISVDNETPDVLALPAPADIAAATGTAIPATALPDATGGTAPYAYAVTGLPAGVTASSATPPVLSGTPTAVGTATVTYRVTDSATPPDTVTQTFTITVSDVTAPAFQSSAVNGTTLTITFDEALAATANLANNAFTVRKTTGTPASVTLAGAPAIRGATVTLTLATASAAVVGDVLTVAYTRPATGSNNRLEDASGNEVESFAAQAVTNNTSVALALPDPADVTAATGTAITATALPAATGGTAPYAYRVTGLPAGVTASSAAPPVLSGTPTATGTATVTYRVTDSATPPDTVTRTFTIAVADGVAPDIPSGDRSVTVNGATLTITFDEALDADSVPDASAFRVTVDGEAAELAATGPVAVSGATVTLTLAAAVMPGQTVTVAYTAPASNPLRDAAGNEAAGLVAQPVANATSDAAPTEAWLHRFGRAAAEQVLDAVTRRLQAPRIAGFQGSLAGRTLAFGPHEEPTRAVPAAAPGTAWWPPASPRTSQALTGRELLDSAFSLTGAQDGLGGSLTLWGRGTHTRFEGGEGELELEGAVSSGLLGADYARDRWTAGLALMHTESEGDYAETGATGTIDTTLTATVPYGTWQASAQLRLWGAAGYGEGEATLEPASGTPITSDIDWQMAAAGLRSELPVSTSRTSAALTADVLWTRTGADGTDALSDDGIHRVRVGLEGSWIVTRETGTLVPRLVSGLRHDGGDAEKGTGLEIGGGLVWRAARTGLSLELEGRALVAHNTDEHDDFRDYGLASTLSYDPSPGTLRGPSLSLRQGWGNPSGSGLEALFAAGPLSGRTGAAAPGPRWQAEAAYGFRAFGIYTGTPRIGIGLAAGIRDYTLGWRLTPENWPADLSLDVRAVRREDIEAADHQIGIGFMARW